MIDKFPDISINYTKEPYVVPQPVLQTMFCTTGVPGDPPYRAPAEGKNDDELVDDLHTLALDVENCAEPDVILQRKLILMLKLAAIKISELQRKIDDDY